jgi:hypothetical protein
MAFVRTLVLAVLVCALGVPAVTAAAAPTPVPGGANQVNALSGKLGQTLFNGIVRLKVDELRDATAADHPETALPDADQRVMVLSALVRNGSHADFAELLTYTLADNDDVTFEIKDYLIKPNPVNILQGSAAHQRALFVVDAGYHPTKLIVRCPTCSNSHPFRAFRITL